MKKRILFTGLCASFILLSAFGEALSNTPLSGKNKLQQQITLIRGKVVDAETNKPLVFAGVAVKESNVSTVTNVDGEFLIKIPEGEGTNIEFSYVGYKNKTLPVSEMKNNGSKNIIAMEMAMIPLKEIVVKPITPDEIVSEAIKRFGDNYPLIPNDMTGFYRETIKKNRNYVTIGEAVLEIFKAPYENDLRFDAAKIYKGRKNNDIEKLDTVLFKLQGGPVTSLELDMVKNPENLLTKESLQQYDLTLSNIVMIDDRANYVIDFQQKPYITTTLFLGRLYIDMETFAVSLVEFGFNLTNKNEAASMFIRKKPVGMNVTPENTSYLVRYRESDGKWYFSYSRAEVKFKVDWKKKLFNTNYITMTELAITDRTDEDVVKFTSKERMKATDLFTEEVSAFADDDFWGEYNVIEPDQSIESAIRRLSRKLKFSSRTEE